MILSTSLAAGNDKLSKPGRVFLVVAIDTEPNRFALDKYEARLDMSCFAKQGRGAMIAQVMDQAWRDSRRDAFGNSLKITWFIMTHEAFLHSTNGSATAVFDSLKTFERQIEQFGDEIGWHYHHADWCDNNQDDTSYWNQLITFDGTQYTHGTDTEIAERMLNHLLVERGFFPSSFRSGWLWENNEFSRWLDDIVPFDYSASPGTGNVPRTIEPRQNQYDWSRAPAVFAGYHPHLRDHQKIGNMRRWLFSGLAPSSRVRLRQWEAVLKAAKEGEDQVVWIATHSYNDIGKFVDQSLRQLLAKSDSMGIPMQFATATEAASAVTGLACEAGTELTIRIQNDTVVITANQPVFQRSPYCAVRYNSGDYDRLRLTPQGHLKWVAALPEEDMEVLVCGASDQAGRSLTTHYDFR